MRASRIQVTNTVRSHCITLCQPELLALRNAQGRWRLFFSSFATALSITSDNLTAASIYLTQTYPTLLTPQETHAALTRVRRLNNEPGSKGRVWATRLGLDVLKTRHFIQKCQKCLTFNLIRLQQIHTKVSEVSEC